LGRAKLQEADRPDESKGYAIGHAFDLDPEPDYVGVAPDELSY